MPDAIDNNRWRCEERFAILSKIEDLPRSDGDMRNVSTDGSLFCAGVGVNEHKVSVTQVVERSNWRDENNRRLYMIGAGWFLTSMFLMTCCGRRRRVSWAVLRRKTSKPRSRGDEAAKRRLAAPASGISAPLALVKSERDPSEQDSAHCPLGTGVAGHSAPRVGSIRKRRRSLIADRPACGGGEPPCYQHLFEGL